MNLNRRRLFQYAVLAGGSSATLDGAKPVTTLAVLRDASRLHGANLADDRLKAVQPAVELAVSRWQQLRAFDVPATTAPTPGILD